ncbi:ATP-grasp domain-containing protein [Streptomyces sp. NPDC057623]|uniref:ATP-grasp domain-containing protein n=1 Tax=Streptomyces sp. NPDC057623 TaxID=3346187 RepID=UPI0036A12FF0
MKQMRYQGYNQRAVAVVDAFSTGHLLGPAFRARGVPVVHVRNRNTALESQIRTFHGPDFQAELDFTDDIADTAARLASLGVVHVVAGIESGSDVADLLATHLATPTANASGFADARRDKRVMHQFLDRAGIAVPWQRHLDARGDTVWQSTGAEPETVVVKPAASAGTDSVVVCRSHSEQDDAVNGILRSTNVYGRQNAGVVVQEYLPGTEYMVNTVSVDGAHAAVEVWRSDKKLLDASPVYDRQVLEDPTEPGIAAVIAYVFSALTALGVRWGSGHSEVIVTPRGPLLLETATRLPGGADPSLGLKALGTSHVDEVVESYLAPDAVADRGPVRPLRRFAMGVSLVSPCSGRMARDLDLRPLLALASFHGARIPLKAGSRVSRTVDLFTKPGGLYLCHEDGDQLTRDYETVREWESVEFARVTEGA